MWMIDNLEIILLVVSGCVLLAAALYLWLIMPRMTGRPDMFPFLEWLYAHRGLYDNTSDAPENSLRAFERAVEANFGIELDVQLSRDGVPVVFHDWTLERICGAEGKISDFTYAELQQFSLCGTDQKIPKLETVLRQVKGRVPLIVELKIAGSNLSVCPAADRLLREYSGMYCVESFNPFGLRWYRKNRKKVVRGQLSECFSRGKEYRGALYFLLQNLLFNWMSKPDFIAYNHRYPHTLSRMLCRKLYRCTSVAWTIKSAEELERARKSFDIFIFDSFVPGKKAVDEE